MREAVIVSGVRTPLGKFAGMLKEFSAPQLGAIVVKEAVKRAGINVDEINEVIIGNVISAGLGQNIARQSSIYAGLPYEVGAFTVNKVCGSSLKSVMLAAQAIKAGDADVIVAGGTESMTNAPYLLDKARFGYRLFDGKIIDAMVRDGLWDVYNEFHMGMTGEIIAEKYNITREECDEFAAWSHEKALKATKEGKFKEEMLPIEIKQKKGDSIIMDRDEGIREDSTPEKLGKLKPVFKENGIVTAGNASQITDGAAAVVVMEKKKAEENGIEPLASIAGYGTGGVKPEYVMEAPIPTVRSLLKKMNLSVDDLDLFEHNEAFSSASVAVMKELGIPKEIFNVHGGAVALGHPIGASGSRCLVTLLYAMKRYGKERGLVTLCLGGGHAVAMVVER
ncbi:acetyl-CoA acetyltransferase [Thermoplasmatales archaeon ex4484_30]|nr:MAG: acetyl-CoA acetyltransferase [Thermoplasmatales archaeon ex4484_30]